MIGRALARRGGLGLLDQAVYSLTNFVPTILLARSLSSADFGAFSLAFAGSVLVVGVVRGTASEPLAVRYSADPPNARLRAIGDALAISLALGALVGLLCFGVAQLLGATIRPAFVALAVVLPGLIVQDTVRQSAIVHDRISVAVVNDLSWGGVQVIAFLLVAALGRTDSVTAGVLAWGGGATVAAVIGILQLHARPRFRGVLRWWRQHRSIAGPFSLEFLAMSGAAQGTTWVVATFAGLAQAGYFRLAQVALGPLTTLLGGLRMILVPEAVRRHDRGGSLWRFTLTIGGAMALMSAGWGLFVLLVPEEAGVAVIGEGWRQARDVLPGLALARVAVGLTTGAFIGLRALAIARASLRLRVVMGVVSLALGSVGAAIGGARGAAWGLGIASVAATAAWWWQYNAASSETVRPRVSRRTPDVPPAPDQSDPHG